MPRTCSLTLYAPRCAVCIPCTPPQAWAETAEFALLEHVSSGSGKKTHIIQQWKDLFTEVGDNQSLLQVLPTYQRLYSGYAQLRRCSGFAQASLRLEPYPGLKFTQARLS
jgi:hypothetical protein